jgi:hypothetical protein
MFPTVRPWLASLCLLVGPFGLKNTRGYSRTNPPQQQSSSKTIKDVAKFRSPRTLNFLEFETVDHLFIHCRFSIRLWDAIKGWIGIPTIHSRQWTGLSIFAWWKMMAGGTSPDRKVISSLTLLVTWEICNKGTRVFRNKQALLHVVLDRVNSQARLWVTAGARHLSNIMPKE